MHSGELCGIGGWLFELEFNLQNLLSFCFCCALLSCVVLAVFAMNAVDYTTQFKFKLEADDTIIDASNMSVGKVEISTTTNLLSVGSEA